MQINLRLLYAQLQRLPRYVSTANVLTEDRADEIARAFGDSVVFLAGDLKQANDYAATVKTRADSEGNGLGQFCNAERLFFGYVYDLHYVGACESQEATLGAAINKFSISHRKEGKCFFSAISVISLAAKPWNDGRLDAEITLRLYGTGSKNFACLWISGQDRRGSGSAGGYGYHRPSAAAQEAINNAGISLALPIDGRGEEAMREALFAIARALKIKRPAIVEAHP